jgi:hypothetical protein
MAGHQETKDYFSPRFLMPGFLLPLQKWSRHEFICLADGGLPLSVISFDSK